MFKIKLFRKYARPTWSLRVCWVSTFTATVDVKYPIDLNWLQRKNDRYRIKPENLRRWTIHIRHLSDVSVSRNWYKTVSKLYENSLTCKFVLNRSYSANTQAILKRLYSPETWESQVCSHYSFFILHF